MHKKIKLLVSMLAAAAMLVLLPGGNAMTAHAEEAKTYSIKYIGGNVNDWRYVSGNTFEDGMSHREIYYLKTENLKNGDHIVIYPGDDVPSSKELDLSDFRLGSLTVHQNARAAILTGGVKDCYVLAGAYTAINGEVTNAHLYDNTTCTFNNNVLDLTLHLRTDTPHSNISCGGTVGMFHIVDNANQTNGLFYDIPNNTMKYENGTIQFPQWSPEPTEAYLQAKAAANEAAANETATTETPAAAETPADTSAGSSAPATPAPGPSPDEYDRVPKTGDSNDLIWSVSLIGIAAVLFAGSYGLYKKAN